MSESAERKRKAADADLYVDLTKDEPEESEERIILASNVRGGKLEYLVKWAGMPDSESSWVPAEDLAHDHELLAAFHTTTSSRHGSPMVMSRPVDNPPSASSHRAYSPQVAVSIDPPSAKRVKVNSSPDIDRVVQLLSSPPQSPSRVVEEEPHSDASAANLVQAPESPAMLQSHSGSPAAAPLSNSSVNAPNTSMSFLESRLRTSAEKKIFQNVCREIMEEPPSSWGSSLRGLDDVEICAESCLEAVIRVSRESLESMDSSESRSGQFADLKFDIEAIRESAPSAYRKLKDATLKINKSFFGILSEQSSVLDEPKVTTFPSEVEVLVATIDIPVIVRDFSDSQIDKLLWTVLLRKLKYGQMRLPAMYEGTDVVRDFYAANGTCLLGATVLDSRSFIAPCEESLDRQMRANSGIWETLYPESTSLQKWNSIKDFSVHDSFSSLQPAVAELASRIWSSTKSDLTKSKKLKDVIRPAHARPSIAAKIAKSLFQLESKSAVYDRHLLNAHLMCKGCSIRIVIPDHEIEFDECWKSNLTRRELICHRNDIDNEALEACAAITGLVVDIKNMVVVEFRTAADEPITLFLEFDELQITHQPNSLAISNQQPESLGDWVKVLNPKDVDREEDDIEEDDDEEDDDEVEVQDEDQDQVEVQDEDQDQVEDEDRDQDEEADEDEDDPDLVWYRCTGKLIKQLDNGHIQVKLPKNKFISCKLSNLRKIDRDPPLPLKVNSVVRIQLPEDQDVPTCGWGRVSKSSVGVVLSVSDGVARVKFPECSKLKVLAAELKVLSNTERFELGALVKPKVSEKGEPPEFGWNLVSKHCVGRIIRIRSATATSSTVYTVRFPFHRKWRGYAESLEIVYNQELSFIADAPAKLATLNTPLARRDSSQLPHELFGPQIDVKFWKTPPYHDPFVYSDQILNLPFKSNGNTAIDAIQELEADIQSRIDCLVHLGNKESFVDQNATPRLMFHNSQPLFREIALNLSLSKSLSSLFIDNYNFNSKHDWFVGSFLPLKLQLADFLSSPDIFSIRTSAPAAPENPNASESQDPLARSIRFSYEPDEAARSRNYQLNVALKSYQQQTVEWMIAEENDPVGFHRHFYDLIQVVAKENRTRYSIWLSALLQDAYLKSDLPLCHGGVVCEEMGLGKTIEVLALIAANRVPRPPRNKLIVHNGYIRHRSSATLVLVPPTLVGQWCDEFGKRHTGDLRLLKYYGPTRPHCPADLLQYDIVLTTFSVLVQEMKKPNSCFDLIHWHRVVVDEAHILKNTSTAQSRFIKQLRAKNKWCLTGTPISSSLAEIQGYLEFLGLAAAQSSKKWADNITYPCRLAILNGLFMRHTKSQLFNGLPLLSLPKITERRIWIQFPNEQRSAYNRLAAKANQLFQRFDHVGRACPRLLEVLSLLLPVRRACSGERFDLAQMELNLEIADQQLMVMGYSQADINAGQHLLLAAPIAYNAEDIECVICLEEMEDPLQTPCRHVFCRACIASIAERLKACPICRQPIDVASLSPPPARQVAVPTVAAVAAEIVHFTAKVDALMHELQQLRRTHPHEKALVFSQFSATLAMVSNRMSAKGMPWRSLSGSMCADQRQRQVELFNNDPPGSVFLLPLRSSAVGLTLTSATHVFMLDPCLNPALEQQAKNRVYRMGQTKDVYFYRLLMKHSVESNMDQLMRNRESEFSSASADAGKKAAYSTDELRMLFSIDAAANEKYETGAGANKPSIDVQPPASAASIASAALPSPAQAESHAQSEMSDQDSSQDQDSEADQVEGNQEQNEDQDDDQGEECSEDDEQGDQDCDDDDQSQSESDDLSVESNQHAVASAPDDVEGQSDDQGCENDDQQDEMVGSDESDSRLDDDAASDEVDGDDEQLDDESHM